MHGSAMAQRVTAYTLGNQIRFYSPGHIGIFMQDIGNTLTSQSFVSIVEKQRRSSFVRVIEMISFIYSMSIDTCSFASGTILAFLPLPTMRMVYGSLLMRTLSTVRSAISDTRAPVSYIKEIKAKSRHPLHVVVSSCSNKSFTPSVVR